VFPSPRVLHEILLVCCCGFSYRQRAMNRPHRCPSALAATTNSPWTRRTCSDFFAAALRQRRAWLHLPWKKRDENRANHTGLEVPRRQEREREREATELQSENGWTLAVCTRDQR